VPVFEQICPVCGNDAIVNHAQYRHATWVNCSKCGRFYLDYSIIVHNNQDLEAKNQTCTYYYLTHCNQFYHNQKSQEISPYFHSKSELPNGEIGPGNVYYISIESIQNIYPKNFSERIDKVLLNLANYCGGIGGTFDFFNLSEQNNQKLNTLCFITTDNTEKNNQEIKDLLSLMTEIGLLQPLNSPQTNSMVTYKITARGWLRVQELEEQNKVIQQGFIAMWFDSSMEDARKKIIQVVEECGYLPRIIDLKEHNNQIVPEIFFEIKRSRFVLADLTGQRNGVYYEAGYAEALNKPVILSCKESDFENRHFDVAQKNTIQWKDLEDLYKRLKDRIKATVGENNEDQLLRKEDI